MNFRGEVKVVMDASQHKQQYSKIFAEATNYNPLMSSSSSALGHSLPHDNRPSSDDKKHRAVEDLIQ